MKTSNPTPRIISLKNFWLFFFPTKPSKSPSQSTTLTGSGTPEVTPNSALQNTVGFQTPWKPWESIKVDSYVQKSRVWKQFLYDFCWGPRTCNSWSPGLVSALPNWYIVRYLTHKNKQFYLCWDMNPYCRIKENMITQLLQQGHPIV